MGANFALITGAGISADPPVSLPLGREFHGRLLDLCYTAAVAVAPEAVDRRGLSRVAAIPRNVLSRLAASGGAGPVDSMLECFRVAVPTEAHLLAAVHAARGTLVLTLNFDDGVEQAYALLSGSADLPPYAPEEYRVALRGWRHTVRPDSPLTVVTSNLGAVDYRSRPMLVKLRGSVGTGFDAGLLSAQPASPRRDDSVFSSEQSAALAAAASTAYVFIAGVSGSDVDCRRELIPLLSRGGFAWTAAELPAEVVAELRAIDPGQPVLRPALDGLRVSLPEHPDFPPWPRSAVSRPGFDDRFEAWQKQFPPWAAAEAYASLLYDAGLARQAVAVLRGLLEHSDNPRTYRLLSRAMTASSRDTARFP